MRTQRSLTATVLRILACCSSAFISVHQRPVMTLAAPPTLAPLTPFPIQLTIPMRDHVRLAARLFPSSINGPAPTILIRTPYGEGAVLLPTYKAFVDRGYNVVYQDVRGRPASEGTFAPFTQEPQDGEDTLNWIAAQPWSNGNIGMSGGSYRGITQWKVAVRNNPHLKAIFPVNAGDDDYRDRTYSPGGAMKWGHRLEWAAQNMHAPGYQPPQFEKFIWTLPPRNADRVVTGRTTSMLQIAFDHPSYDAFWKGISVRERLLGCNVPVLSVGGWYDNYVEGDLDAFAAMRNHSGLSRIIVGPWPHDMSFSFKTVNFGSAASLSVRKLQLEWFDQWLLGKDTPFVSKPPLLLFVMGANVWRDEQEWPLARAVPTKFFLDSKGNANSLSGDGALTETPSRKGAEDRFTYDPAKPVMTVGGSVCCNNKVFPWGPMDQRQTEARKDVLVYTSEPMQEDLEITGPISLTLFAATSAPDTDWTGKLVDVYPGGKAINLTDGILRARYREGLDKPKLLRTNRPVKYVVDVGVTSNVFRKGHRIRLEVSSSNFPRFDRNPNTGRAIADETRLVRANQTVYHRAFKRSYLLLPVIPAKSANTVIRSSPPSAAPVQALRRIVQ